MAVVVSAPGKVLITGAYLVLEQPNAGLVLSTSARFYAVVKPICEVIPEDTSKFWSWADVRVLSPQLRKCSDYKLSLRTCQLQQYSGNFVEDAVQFAVAAALSISKERGERQFVYKRLLHGLEVTILGSNDFYSFRKQIEAKGLALASESLASLPKFSPILMNEGNEDMAPEVAKTGLGSSAAMTAAIVGAILQYLGIVQLPVRSDEVRYDSLDLVHAVSQAAHCHAQGKVGSGFDISAAVYGSQRYVRFSPSVLDPAMIFVDEKGCPVLLENAVKAILDMQKWDCKRSAFALPQMLHLVLGEPGYGGSHTPSMVGAVRKWRDTHPNAATTWKDLASANAALEEDLLLMKEAYNQDSENYIATFEACNNLQADELQNGKTNTGMMSLLLRTRRDFNIIRSHLRHIGEELGTPIEPASQTELLDATMSIPGVLFAGVPGAGGYDAIFAVTMGKGCKQEVEKLWSERGVLLLTVEEDACGLSLEEQDPREE